MEEPGHAAAARRYAGEAKSGSGDPVVLVGLAQTEALLAVATAIDRLAAALSRPGTAAPSPVHPQTYQVEEIRRQYPNAYRPWTAETDTELLTAHRAGHDVATLADTFGRQPSAIRSRLNHLGAHAPAEPPAESSPHPGSGAPR